jgi:hypothetical protein
MGIQSKNEVWSTNKLIVVYVPLVSIEGIVSCEDDVREGLDDQSFNEDLCLVNRVKTNDSITFDILVKKYRERLFSMVYNMTSNRDNAFDIIQKVFLKAYRGIKSFNGKSTFLLG